MADLIVVLEGERVPVRSWKEAGDLAKARGVGGDLWKAGGVIARARANGEVVEVRDGREGEKVLFREKKERGWIEEKMEECVRRGWGVVRREFTEKEKKEMGRVSWRRFVELWGERVAGRVGG